MLHFGSRFYQLSNVPDGFLNQAQSRFQRFPAASERFHVSTLPNGAMELRATLDRDDVHIQGFLVEQGIQAQRESSVDFYTGVFGKNPHLNEETARQLAEGHLRTLANQLPQ